MTVGHVVIAVAVISWLVSVWHLMGRKGSNPIAAAIFVVGIILGAFTLIVMIGVYWDLVLVGGAP